MQWHTISKEEFHKCFDQWKTCWNTARKIGVSFILHFFLGKCNFNLDTFRTHLIYVFWISWYRNVVWIFLQYIKIWVKCLIYACIWQKYVESWINQTLNSNFDLSNFPHISTILSDSLQIYLFNIYIYIYIYIYIWYWYRYIYIYIYISPVGWGYRIHWLRLCRGVISPRTSVLIWH